MVVTADPFFGGHIYQVVALATIVRSKFLNLAVWYITASKAKMYVRIARNGGRLPLAHLALAVVGKRISAQISAVRPHSPLGDYTDHRGRESSNQLIGRGEFYAGFAGNDRMFKLVLPNVIIQPRNPGGRDSLSWRGLRPTDRRAP